MKLGIVLEGGASRTAFSCGVLDFFLEQNIIADYLIGVSAGIAYGSSYASGQLGRNLEINRRFLPDKRYMGMRHLLSRKNRSYYNLQFVFDEVPNHLLPFDYEAFRAYPGKVVAVVTNIKTGLAEYMEVPWDDKQLTVIRASCALPFLFKPIEINGTLYMDGGLSDSIPYQKALDEGCDRIIVVLTRERRYRKAPDPSAKLAERVYHQYPNLVRDLRVRHEVYNNSIDNLSKLENQGKVFVIAPDDTHGIGRTESNPDILCNFQQEGYEKAKSVYPALQEYLSGSAE